MNSCTVDDIDRHRDKKKYSINCFRFQTWNFTKYSNVHQISLVPCANACQCQGSKVVTHGSRMVTVNIFFTRFVQLVPGLYELPTYCFPVLSNVLMSLSKLSMAPLTLPLKILCGSVGDPKNQNTAQAKWNCFRAFEWQNKLYISGMQHKSALTLTRPTKDRKYENKKGRSVSSGLK